MLSFYKYFFVFVCLLGATGVFSQRPASDSTISFGESKLLLSHYSTGIDNLASYFDYECSPLRSLKIVAALRYDIYHYNFRNALPSSASTGSPDTRNDFNRVTPKIGATWNRRGFWKTMRK